MAFSYKVDKQSLIRDFSKGALVWYNFRQNSRILYIYSRQADEAILELLESKGKVENCSVEQLLNNQNSNYIIICIPHILII